MEKWCPLDGQAVLDLGSSPLKVRTGLLHGEVTGRAGQDATYPCSSPVRWRGCEEGREYGVCEGVVGYLGARHSGLLTLMPM